MHWPVRVAIGSHASVHQLYTRACHHVADLQPTEPPSWWGFSALLSRHYLRHGSIRSILQLWSELLPFLLMDDERVAEAAVEEYLLYLEDRRSANIEWLGARIDEGLRRVDTWRAAIAAVLPRPALVLRSPWLALLNYQTLLRVRRAIAVYQQDHHLRQVSYWHGLFHAAPRGTAASPSPNRPATRRHLWCPPMSPLAGLRRYRPPAVARLSRS